MKNFYNLGTWSGALCIANAFNFYIADGLDFYYAKKDDAKKMVEFLLSVVPCK